MKTKSKKRGKGMYIKPYKGKGILNTIMTISQCLYMSLGTTTAAPARN